MSKSNGVRGRGEWVSLTVGYAVVFGLLGLVAGGGAVFGVGDGVSRSLVIAFAGFATFALLVCRVLWVIARPVGHEPGETADGGGSGGGGSCSPLDPGPSGSDDLVVDWEHFERDFHAYAQRQRAVNRTVRG